jgi:hypothetical protein
VAGSCEHGDEPSGSIKCEEFLDYLSVLSASQEGLCSMELVSYIHIRPITFRPVLTTASFYISPDFLTAADPCYTAEFHIPRV